MSKERYEFGVAATVAARALDILNDFVLPSIPSKKRDKEEFEKIEDDITDPTALELVKAIEETVDAVVAGHVKSTKTRIDGFPTPKHAWPKVEWTTKLVTKTNTIKVQIKVGTVVRACSSMTVDLTFKNKPVVDDTPKKKKKTVKARPKKDSKKTKAKPGVKSSRPKKRVKTG